MDVTVPGWMEMDEAAARRLGHENSPCSVCALRTISQVPATPTPRSSDALGPHDALASRTIPRPDLFLGPCPRARRVSSAIPCAAGV